MLIFVAFRFCASFCFENVCCLTAAMSAARIPKVHFRSEFDLVRQLRRVFFAKAELNSLPKPNCDSLLCRLVVTLEKVSFWATQKQTTLTLHADSIATKSLWLHKFRVHRAQSNLQHSAESRLLHLGLWGRSSSRPFGTNKKTLRWKNGKGQ